MTYRSLQTKLIVLKVDNEDNVINNCDEEKSSDRLILKVPLVTGAEVV